LREHPAFIQGYFHDVQRRHAFLYIDKADYHDGISHLGLQYDNGDIKQCYNQNCG
jgi:hypothetical protein